MGINGSIEADTPFNEHFFGLVNFGNTCYVNSVLQALYFCKPFREKIIQYKLEYNKRTSHLQNKDLTNNNSNLLNPNSNDINEISLLNNQTNSTNNSTNNPNSLNNNKDPKNINTNNNSNTNSNNNNAQQSILKQEHLLNCLAELFYSIVTMKKKKGTVQPKKFIARLRKDNEAFDNLIQQDAHEFLNYLLNTCADILKTEMKELKELRKLEELNRQNENSVRLNTKNHRSLHKASSSAFNSSNNNSNQSNGALSKQNSSGYNQTNSNNSNQSTGVINNNSSNNSSVNPRNSSTNGSNRSLSSQNSTHSNINPNNSSNLDDINRINSVNGANGDTNSSNGDKQEELTWIHELFQGILVNETKCLNCETSSSKEENFLDLSVDVEQNTSISHCLQEFSNMEMLYGECKYYCENCCSKQEAEKRMRIKKLPRILALHLKRFKFVGALNKFKKLTYRVVFPFELRLFNTTEDCSNSERIYDLVSFVVHCGMGLNRGHYISVVKSRANWFLFDDEQVEKIEVSNFEEFYGLTQDTNKKSETAYILFYESRQN